MGLFSIELPEDRPTWQVPMTMSTEEQATRLALLLAEHEERILDLERKVKQLEADHGRR